MPTNSEIIKLQSLFVNGNLGGTNFGGLITIENGKKCLEFLENNLIPDVIILDIMMPEMSGWKTFDKIKENLNWNKIPIVFLTARTDNVAKNAGGFLGEAYIEKPFEITFLKDKIDEILKK